MPLQCAILLVHPKQSSNQAENVDKKAQNKTAHRYYEAFAYSRHNNCLHYLSRPRGKNACRSLLGDRSGATGKKHHPPLPLFVRSLLSYFYLTSVAFLSNNSSASGVVWSGAGGSSAYCSVHIAAGGRGESDSFQPSNHAYRHVDLKSYRVAPRVAGRGKALIGSFCVPTRIHT